MRRSTLWMCALLAIATLGCEQINTQISKLKQKIAARRSPPAQTRPAPAPPPATPAQPEAPAPQPPPPPRPKATALRDVPYDSPDTGTVAPGMSERDVYTLWGPPAAVRRQGEYTYLFFQNGCEYSCGTMDLVMLQNGQVVDAIVRWPGHGYSGQSSSPPGRMPEPTPGGDTLTMRSPTP